MNSVLQPAIDPYKIGRTVGIHFAGAVSQRSYNAADYASDIHRTQTTQFHTPDISALATSGPAIIGHLFDSGIASYLDSEARPVLFGTPNNDQLSPADTALFDLARTTNGVAIVGGGGSYALRGGDYDDHLIGGELVDSLSGGSGSDVLEGGNDGDFLEGGTGFDILIGGSGGDQYSIGLKQGPDIIDDRGGAGHDILALYVGDTFSTVNDSWFTIDGNDLVIQAYEASTRVIDVHIKDMGVASGSIEELLLFAGNGDGSATASFDLGKYWASKTDQPIPTDPLPTDIPQPSDPFDFRGDASHSYFWGTSSNETVGGGNENDTLYGNGGDDFILGQGGVDYLDGGSNDDTLVDDDTSDGLFADNLNGQSGAMTLLYSLERAAHQWMMLVMEGAATTTR